MNYFIKRNPRRPRYNEHLNNSTKHLFYLSSDPNTTGSPEQHGGLCPAENVVVCADKIRELVHEACRDGAKIPQKDECCMTARGRTKSHSLFITMGLFSMS